MVGVLIGNRFKSSIYEPQINVDTQQLIYLVIYNMLIGIGLNVVGGSSFINIWAHVGGFIAGLILGMFLSTMNAFYLPKWKRILTSIISYSAIIILIGSFAGLIYYSIIAL